MQVQRRTALYKITALHASIIHEQPSENPNNRWVDLAQIRPVSSEPDIVMAHGSTGDQTELFFFFNKETGGAAAPIENFIKR